MLLEHFWLRISLQIIYGPPGAYGLGPYVLMPWNISRGQNLKKQLYLERY